VHLGEHLNPVASGFRERRQFEIDCAADVRVTSVTVITTQSEHYRHQANRQRQPSTI
jgi:hypothetical protein